MYVIFYMDGWLIVFVSVDQIDERTAYHCAFRVGVYLCNVLRRRETKTNGQWYMFVAGEIAHALDEFAQVRRQFFA